MKIMMVAVRESGKWSGPKLADFRYPNIQDCIREIVDASIYGDPGKVLSCTTESLRKISAHIGIKI
jgi:hypothetical protein